MTYRHGFCDKFLELEAKINVSTKASNSREANWLRQL